MLDHPKTRGSILVVSTLILSILAGLSIATLQNVVTEYKLTTQNQDYNLALSSAQYAVAEAKRLVLTNWAPGATPCAAVSGCAAQNGIAVWSYSAFTSAPNNTDFSQQPASYFITNAQATANNPNPMVSQAPRFFVIDLGCDPYSKVNIYRIIAIGFGASAKTVAYADSQLTMPLTGQNSYPPVAQRTAVTGVAAPVTNPVLPTQQAYSLGLSTNSGTLFFPTVGGSTCTGVGQSGSTGATCEMNCLGEVRVKGYSSYNNAQCPWYYGDWVKMDGSSGITQSQLTLTGSAGSVNLMCGPCGIFSVPLSVCPITGRYSSCAPAGCVSAGCLAGQYLNGGSCANCPAGTYSGAGANSCTPCSAGTYNTSTGQATCAQCPANTYSQTVGATNSSVCTTCPANSSSSAGARVCMCNGSGQSRMCNCQCDFGNIGCFTNYLCTQHVQSHCHCLGWSVP